MKLEEFAGMMRRTAADADPFRPMAYYDPDGDCIEVFFSNDHFVGKRLDKWVTVYINPEKNEIIGSLIKDVSKLMRQFPGLAI